MHPWMYLGILVIALIGAGYWSWPATPLDPEPASFQERVRRRAYQLWIAEGCPADRAEQNWRIAEALENEAVSGDDAALTLSEKIERLQFRSELAEVQLLLDFISGRADKAFGWSAIPARAGVGTLDAETADRSQYSASILEHAIRTPGITVEELRQVATIRFPPREDIAANAADAALLTVVRDKLNRIVRPASGLTVAFTLLIWKPWLRSARRSKWVRWHLANEAFPLLQENVFKFRVGAMVLLIIGIVLSALTGWFSTGVADGTAKLNRIQALQQKQTAVEDLIRQLETSQLPLDIMPNNNRGLASPHYVVRYCEKASQIPPRQLKGFKTIPQFDSTQQLETCDTHDRLERDIFAANLELNQWRANWEHSLAQIGEPINAGWCRVKPLLGIDAADCRPGPAPPDTPFLWAATGSHIGIGVANQADDVSETYGSAADMLSRISNIWLPVMYGSIGSIVAAMRSMYQKISTSTLAPWDMRLLWTKLLLGVMAGGCVGLFFSPSGTNVQGTPGISTLSLSAIAFLAGYAVDGLFALLDEIIKAVFRLTPDPMDRNS